MPKALVLVCALLAPLSATHASSLAGSFEAETMTYTGYTGPVPDGQPFAGLRFYANGDQARAPLALPAVPGRYRLEIRGASSTGGTARISVFLGAVRAAVASFTGTVPSTFESTVSVSRAPAPDSLFLRMESDDGSFDTDVDWVRIWHEGDIPPPPPPPVPPDTGSFVTGAYRNLFALSGRSESQITRKLDTAWSRLFYGRDEDQRVYYPVGSDMAYILDAGNNDVRSEGMSYAMMICVQMDRKTEFDRLWKWVRTYMYNSEGEWKGYYAWQVATDGRVIDRGSAPDGEEYFVMALLFASHRWGDGAGVFNYGAMARELLDEMLHHEERVSPYSGIRNMFNAAEKKVVFSPNNQSALFTDPSYHLPAFYELWALWDSPNRAFWRAVADSSRAFFVRATHPETGLSPDYAEFSGAPNTTGGHGDFRFDAWRTAANIAMDYAWWARDQWQKTFADRIQSFFEAQGIGTYANQFRLDGTPLSSDHSPGLVAMNAVASLAATHARAWNFVDALWELEVPSGRWRYYDGMLYLLGLLHCSGRFRIYAPGSTTGGFGRESPGPTRHGELPLASRHYDLRGRRANGAHSGAAALIIAHTRQGTAAVAAVPGR